MPLRIKKPKYELQLIDGNQIMIDREMKKLQDDGWELAGPVYPYLGTHDYKGMLVVLKRRIN